jgi:hypothetical protein
VVDDTDQTVYVVGTFKGPVDFDPFGADDVETSNDPANRDDCFIVGLSASTGHETNSLFDDFAPAFAGHAGNSFTVAAVTTDSSGRFVYVGGQYAGGRPVTFFGGGRAVTLPPPTGGSEAYLVKFSQGLAVQWAANPSGPPGSTFDHGSLQGIASSAQNGIDYVVGDEQFSTEGFIDIVDDADGSVINEHRLTTTSTDGIDCAGVVADRAGNAYVVGTYSDQLMPTSTRAPLVCSGDNDVFLVKFDDQLNEVWGVRFGSANHSGDDIGTPW